MAIKHYGTPRKSGRYPWGSGKDPHQRTPDFLSYVDELKKQGLSETEIAAGLGMNTRQLRERRSIAVAERRAANVAQAQRLYDKGYSKSAIGRRMGVNESVIRSWLDPALQERANSTALTATILKDAVDNKGLIDIGIGTEQYLGVARTKMNTAVAMLKEQGYEVHTIDQLQVSTGKYTKIKVLAPPGTTFAEVSKNRENIKMVDSYSEDGGRSFRGLELPVRSVDSNRIMIRYGDEGGADRDGVIQLRRGVDDLSLGDKAYAQVRIGVDGSHFMKGMAMYADDIPAGFDVIYNTNKKRGTPYNDIYKVMKDDPDNPFGTTLRQRHYIGPDGKEHLSAINVVGSLPGAGEEGSWETWSRNLSSQILSKQHPALARKQLGLAFDIRKEELDEILSLTNPSVKKAMLTAFADSVDSDSVHLKAAALPRQASQVLLPFKTVKETEVYAPNFKDGENVVLIRHPHAGPFEIAELIVNNRNAEARGLIGRARDAVGINPKVANRLSGADFDGDAVIVIPNKNRLIRTASPLKGLENFDPKTAYKGYEGMRVMDNPTKQMEMGKISNLITDMTVRGASHAEIARAVKHSMVVIDAEKHKLNYKQSYMDNNIAELKEKYQGGRTAGASTLISRAGATVRIPERREGVYRIDPKTGKKKRFYIDPDTGEKLYEPTGRTYVNKKGKIVEATTKVKRLAYEKDASKLSSGSVIEEVYASHSNKLKALANKARRIVLGTDDIPYSRSAARTFAKEVSSLKDALALAYRNKPLERKAQVMANKWIAAKRRDNPDMTPSELKKIKYQALEEARTRYGAQRSDIKITDRQWLAIQAGAISPSALNKILKNTDVTRLREKALPHKYTGVSPARVARAKAMLDSGYTRADVAYALGISIGTLSRALEEG